MRSALIPFGIVFCIASLAIIIIPYLLGRRHLLTTFNLFMLGSANFVGYAALLTGLSDPLYTLFTTDEHYLHFMAGATIIYFFILAVYFFPSNLFRPAYPQPVIESYLPDRALLIAAIVCLPLGALSRFPPNIQGFGQIIILVGVASSVISAMFCYILWLRDRFNPIYIGFALLTAINAMLIALSAGTTRRALLNVLLGYVVVTYWTKLRHAPRALQIGRFAISGLVISTILIGYTAIRHREKDNTKIGVNYALESINMLPTAIKKTFGNYEGVLGGDSVEASLLAIQNYYSTNETRTLWTLQFLIAQPIPRAFWPEKPESLGTILPREAGMWARGYINLGPGVVGHAFFEGGYWVCVLYGLLLGFLLRWGDKILLRRPDDPCILAIIAAMSGEIVAFSRGDLGVFGVNIIAALGTGLIMRWLLYRLWGESRVATNTEFPVQPQYY